MARWLFLWIAILVCLAASWQATSASAQARRDPAGADAPNSGGPKWREANAPGRVASNPDAGTADNQRPLRAVPTGPPRAPIAQVRRGSGNLPNDTTGDWREYDISPYTARVTSTNKPEEA